MHDFSVKESKNKRVNLKENTFLRAHTLKRHIYIFRHGETNYNKSKRFTGCINSRLTKSGIEQTKIIAEKLKEKKVHVAFKTSLSRSSQSLEIVLKYHPECRKIIIDDRIIERSYGDLEGKYHETIIKTFGKKQFDIWHRSYNIPPPGGESIEMVEKRVLSFIEDLIMNMKKEKINVLISAHNNSMRPFRRYFENLTAKQMMEIENPNNEYFEYSINC
jgi:2,3-bisphosphoglycerate-dependent phosphoglycerate mutase